MNEKRSPLIKLINYLYRYTQFYNDRALEKFQLSTGTYPYLLILYENEGISQNQISKELNVDKAMSARTIKKLIELNYIRKQVDEEDSRAYKLFLTNKAKLIVPEIRVEIDRWVELISEGCSKEEKELAIDFLNKALLNAKHYKDNIEKEGFCYGKKG